MRRLIQSLWTAPRITGLLIGAILFPVLRHSGFSSDQSRVLSFAFLAIYFMFLEPFVAWQHKTATFEPYAVEIYVRDWFALLFKYKLVKSEEEWEQVRKDVETNPRFGLAFRFTVLSNNSRGVPHLLYSDDYKRFVMGPPAFSDHLGKLLGIEVGGVKEQGQFTPRLFFGEVSGKREGYEMGLCVQGYLWEALKTPDVDGTETCRVHGHETMVYLILARLPYCELGMDQEAFEKHRGTRTQELTDGGWTITDREYASWHVKHTHFSVWQGKIRASQYL